MELTHDSDLFVIIKMLNTFGKHSNLVSAYTELFGLRPLKSKTKKWRILLEEMKRLFDSETFNYQKRAYFISQAGIVEALNQVVHRNFTDGLESHNYLKKIMITISEKENREAGKQLDKGLREKEASLMAGNRVCTGTFRDSGVSPEEGRDCYPVQDEQIEAPPMRTMPAARLTDAEVEANRKRLKKMIEGIGGQ